MHYVIHVSTTLRGFMLATYFSSYNNSYVTIEGTCNLGVHW